MAKPLSWFINKKLLLKDTSVINLARPYMAKARSNIVTMELLSKAQNFREVLALPADYDPNEWVVISGYYSMYVSGLAVIAKIGYKSSNHTATRKALEEFFVKKNLLEKEYLAILDKVKIQKEEIEELDKVRDRREIAQYSVTKLITKNIAEETKISARKFVDRMEELFELLP